MRFAHRLTPVALLALACSAPERPAYEIDCDPEPDIELFDRAITAYDGEDSGWYSFGDLTPGAHPVAEAPEEPDPVETEPWATEIEDGGRCGSTEALVFEAHGHNDWGCGFGTWKFNEAPADGTDSDGIAVWARSPGATDKSVTLNVHDLHTSEEAHVALDPDTGENLVDSNTGEILIGPDGEPVKDPATQQPLLDEDGRYVTGCKPREADEEADVALCPVPTAEGTIQLLPCGGEIGGLNDCGNPFRRVLTVTERWQLYLLPWDTFYQQALPNRRPHGIDPTAIHQILILAPAGAHLELWLDDITFYRNR